MKGGWFGSTNNRWLEKGVCGGGGGRREERNQRFFSVQRNKSAKYPE